MTQAASAKIIAHRGGVVGDEFAENSPASLEAAVDRDYWMIEVDIREEDAVLDRLEARLQATGRLAEGPRSLRDRVGPDQTFSTEGAR